MILKDLKFFSQNIQKNNFIINTILKTNNNFDIIFIQKPSVIKQVCGQTSGRVRVRTDIG